MSTAADRGAGRAAVLRAAAAVALAGPTALAFFSGGYFTPARDWSGLFAWTLAAVAIALAPRPLPRATCARAALVALAGLAAWTLASIAWAPTAGGAWDAGQIAILYVGALIAAIPLVGGAGRRAAEPALAAGTAIVIGYGLAGRLLPGLLHYARSITAQGRLEQPLTYWNATGELAALGFVLATRLAGDPRRPRALRIAAAAACPLLGLGVYMSFSRGALFACAAGLVALLVLAPRRAQLRALALAVASAVVASVAAAPFRGVTLLAGSLASREREGAIVLPAELAITVAAVLLAARLGARAGGDRPLRLPRRSGAIAVAAICAGLGVAIALGAHESSAQPLAPGATRYATLESNRYAYWDVALEAFASQPLRGVGAGGWAVWWLRHRTVNEGAQDAHSLELQTLAELGLVGAALLAALIAATAAAARRALRAAPAAAAGPIAALVVYIAHSPLDWDWQMPAVTLVAVAAAGLVLALADAPQDRDPEAARLHF
ncbi:MAG TPA: O-antigen ligase family protein [Solirubrobacteraceae bacterium]|nr:O-antigen ligase family protein [Solirubrobacteraceae bacterium]